MKNDFQTAQVFTDFSGLAKLRYQAKSASDESLEAVAKQFESIFTNMMLKSMRQASLGDPIFDSSQTKFYQDLFDQQLAIQLSDNGSIGLVDVIVRQLKQSLPDNERSAGEQKGLPPLETPPGIGVPTHLPINVQDFAPRSDSKQENKRFATEQGLDNENVLAARVKEINQYHKPFTDPVDFVHRLWDFAKQAAAKLSVAPEAILAQAALETGWGKHIIQAQNGELSHNLFAIKADTRWSGKDVVTGTLEFQNGVMQREQARFRAYASFSESFEDYVDFLRSNPRYRSALSVGNNGEEFISQLQRAGYATDPEYASKIRSIMNSDWFRKTTTELNLL